MALECPNVQKDADIHLAAGIQSMCSVQSLHTKEKTSFVQKVPVVVVRETLAIINCNFGLWAGVQSYPAIQQPGKGLNISTYLNHPWMPWTSSDSTLPRRKRDLREDLEVEGRVARVPIRSLVSVSGWTGRVTCYAKKMLSLYTFYCTLHYHITHYKDV